MSCGNLNTNISEFKKINLENLFSTMNVYNNSSFPIRTLSVNFTTQDQPIGFDTTYFGENGVSDVNELLGSTIDITQNVIEISNRIIIKSNIILNNTISPIPNNLLIYLDKLTNGSTNTIIIKGNHPTLHLLFSLQITYQYIQNILEAKWIILNSNITLSNLTLT